MLKHNLTTGQSRGRIRLLRVLALFVVGILTLLALMAVVTHMVVDPSSSCSQVSLLSFNSRGRFVAVDSPRELLIAFWNSLGLGKLLQRRADVSRCLSKQDVNILMVGDSNMRKRFVALARQLGVYLSEPMITGLSKLPFEAHRCTATAYTVNVGYGFWKPELYAGGVGEHAIPTVWNSNKTATSLRSLAVDWEKTVLIANYGLWAGDSVENRISLDYSNYCDQVRGWRDRLLTTGRLKSSNLFWLTTSPVVLDRLDPVRGAKWIDYATEFLKMDDCARTLGMNTIDGSLGWTPSDTGADGYHVTPRYADTQAKEILDAICNHFS